MFDNTDNFDVLIISKEDSIPELTDFAEKLALSINHHKSYSNIEEILLGKIFDFVIIDTFNNQINKSIKKISTIYPFLYFYILSEKHNDTESANQQLRFFKNRAELKKSLMDDLCFIKSIEEKEKVEERNDDLTEYCGIIGHNKNMLEIYEQIRKVSKTCTNVMILGETGTGKELLAKAIHHSSPRRNGPFIAIDCGAIPSTLLEMELFGYEKGAFTDATIQKKGKFELASGGTMFLDEIGNMPHNLQVKILRVLQEREFFRLGGSRNIAVDIRIVSATKEDIQQLIKENRFRDDLYYRLNVVPIELPPLRNRKDDIPLIINSFCNTFSEKYKCPKKVVSNKALKALISYDWPGNIRELHNILERIHTLADSARIITLNHIPGYILSNSEKENAETGKWNGNGLDFNRIISEVEKDLINKALKKTNGNKKEAAKLLGLKRTTLIEKLKRLDDF